MTEQARREVEALVARLTATQAMPSLAAYDDLVKDTIRLVLAILDRPSTTSDGLREQIEALRRTPLRYGAPAAAYDAAIYAVLAILEGTAP
jgi:hypothetical protein